MRKVTRALIKARDLIDQGWCKGLLRTTRPGGRWAYCASGAVHEAAGVGLCPASLRLDRGMRKRLERALPHRYRDLVSFNDDPDTTKQDVLDLFTRAIHGQKVREKRNGG